MLHWLAGKPPPDGAQDVDSIGYFEPPETPAPVFAVRAFKQALFGTPQTQQSKPRRNSNTEHSRPRNQDGRSQRPGLSRPRSVSDAQGLWKASQPPIPEGASSPTKGILMTPGNGTAKRKTVSFGDNVNNEERAAAMPNDIPGKFPSPWSKSGNGEERQQGSADKARGKSKLTEALELARDDSARRKSKHSKHSKMKEDDDDDVPKEFADPKSDVGKYWKAQYDIYRQNTQREVRKLITKQRAAKCYAQEKDEDCMKLATKLKEESEKVDQLEQKTVELEAQLKEMQSQLSRAKANETNSLQPTHSTSSKTSTQSNESARPKHDIANLGSRMAALRGNRSQPAATSTAPQSNSEAAKIPAHNPSTDMFNGMRKYETTTEPATKPAPQDVGGKSEDDIWAQSFKSSSPVISRSTSKPSLVSNNSRGPTTGTDGTPLKTLSINTMQTDQLPPRRDSPQITSPTDRRSRPSTTRTNSIPSPKREELQSPKLPMPSPEPTSAKSPRERISQPKNLNATVEDGDSKEELSIPIPLSSPFQATALRSPPIAGNRLRGQRSTEKANELPNTKENVAPVPKIRVSEDNVKPSAAWGAINAPSVGKRPVMDKRGKEVGIDRLEAAKARLAARGRVVS